MTISINDANNGFSLRTLERTTKNKESAFRQLATGKRITTAADDAAGLAIAARLTADERSLDQGTRNLNDGISVAQTAEASLSTTSDSLDRLRELSIQAQNGTLNAGDKAVIQQEFDQITQEISRTAASTQFNGRNLLNGDSSGAGAIQLADGSSDNGGQIKIDIKDQSAQSLGIAGLNVSDPKPIQAIDHAIDSVSQTRASLGSVANRIESNIRSNQTTAENTAAARSRIEDVDVAQASAELTRNQILGQQQIALAAQANVSNASALKLLA